MFILEALRAKHGDSLLLHFGTKTSPKLAVIDGGPPGVWNDALRPRLEEIRAERGLADDEPLEIDLLMVSHIDDDHIAGVLQMMTKVKALEEAGQPVPWKVKRFWHNAFDDLLGNDETGVGGASGSAVSVASLGSALSIHGSNLVASVPQGRNLAKVARALGLDGNPPFDGLVRARKKPVTIGNLKLTVVAPLEAELAALEAEWDEKIKPLLKKPKTKGSQAQIAAFVDDSAANLSSLVVLAEADGKRMLLTGDARGDHTLAGLKKLGLLDAAGRIEVDLLKVPHHGSDRNVEESYFRRIRARHLVVSADGKHHNPDRDTLEYISAARPDDDFTIHLTYPTNSFHVASVGKEVASFFKSEANKGRKYKVKTRNAADFGLEVRLA